MIWRVYMYFVSTIEPVIPKNIALEILSIFGIYLKKYIYILNKILLIININITYLYILICYSY